MLHGNNHAQKRNHLMHSRKRASGMPYMLTLLRQTHVFVTPHPLTVALNPAKTRV